MQQDDEFLAWSHLFANTIRHNGIAFPSIDLFFNPPGDLRKKAAAAVTVLAHLHNEQTDEAVFANIEVVAPKEALVLGDLVEAARKQNGGTNASVRLWELEQLTVEAVGDLVTQFDQGSAVVVLSAALFVSGAAKTDPLDTNTRFALSEELWAPQLLHLIKTLEQVNEARKCYVIVEAGEPYPSRRELRDSFMGVDTLAIVVNDHAVKNNETLAAQLEIWKGLLDEGRVGPALESVNALPAVFDNDKPYLRIRVLYEAGLVGQALDEINVLDVSRATVGATLKVAKIAAEAGGRAVSRKLLEAALPQLVSLPDFELAMDVAQLLEGDVLLDQIDAKYRGRYPNQTTQRRLAFKRLVYAGRYEEALHRSTGLPPETVAALEFCCAHLPPDQLPNYPQAARSLRSEDSWVRLAFVWMVHDALRRHLVVYAFELVFGDFRPRNIDPLGDHAFTVMRELMLSIANGAWPVDEERVNTAFRDLVGHVARHPDQPTRRFKLEDLLSHKVVGSRGLAKLLHQVLHAPPPAVSQPIAAPGPLADSERVEATIRALIERLQREGLVVAGHLRATPETFEGGVADEVLKVAEYAIEQEAADALTDDSINRILLWLAIASMAAPHTSTPPADLELHRTAAGRMAIGGQPQLARNLIDMVLANAVGADPSRVREAWFVCADIYSRLRQTQEGFVALNCGLSIQCDVDPAQAVREADVSCRLLRDIHAYDLAEVFYERLSELLRMLGQLEGNLAHEFVGFTIEQGKLRKRSIDSAALHDFLARMARNARQVLGQNLPPAPMALLLGQVILFAEDEGLEVPSEISDVRDALGAKLTGRELTLFQQVATQHATALGLLRLHRASGPARYARDAAYDAGDTAVAARRLLSRKELSTFERSLALELLCDRALPLPGWQGVSQPVHQISSIDEPGKWAAELSRRGIDVVVLGLDERGRAHAVLARDGAVREQKRLGDEFDTEGYLKWSKHYPYLYGIDEKTPNLFALSTEGFNFPFEPLKSTAIVATNRLQLLPPTLYRAGERFLGQLHPVFAAPSLGWLYAASSSPHPTDKRITGWISVAEANGMTLAMVRDRLDEMLVQHQIELNTGAALPEGFWNAEMSFVVAHGSVLPEKRYFQSVSDEGVLKVTTEDFARAFKNIGVVVLFVCSGGRSDQAPEGESTYGLARELLAQGCSTVVASPWPIDPRVTYHWLPKFMEVWRDSTSVAQATFEANKHVEDRYSSELRNCLAMTVFGDGLRLRRM